MIPIIKIKELHSDNRGVIFKVIEDNIFTVLLINSKKGAIRANHYHKKDSHYCFILKGAMEYYEKDINSKNAPDMVIIRAGEGVYTGSNIYHAVRYLEDSIMITLSPKPRSPKEYENDLVRYKLI